MIDREQEEPTKARLQQFLFKYPQVRSPLALTDMRAEKKGFAWLGKLNDSDRARFWSDYRTFLTTVPVAGTACVIDRPSYVARGYGKRYGRCRKFEHKRHRVEHRPDLRR
jgi:hypothetical protein